jgi:hypothetical protein
MVRRQATLTLRRSSTPRVQRATIVPGTRPRQGPDRATWPTRSRPVPRRGRRARPGSASRSRRPWPSGARSRASLDPLDLLGDRALELLRARRSPAASAGRPRASAATRRLSFKEALLSPWPVERKTQGVHKDGCLVAAAPLPLAEQSQRPKLRSLLVMSGARQSRSPTFRSRQSGQPPSP